MLDGYELFERLGRTAGSDLWRGRRLEDGRPVLVKLLPQGARPAQSVRLRREFEMLMALDLPGVVKPIAWVEQSGALAIVLEDVAAEMLEAVLSRGRLDLHDALALARRLAEMVAGVHAAHLLHRDLRPANLLLSPDGRLFLADVHFAVRADRETLPPEGISPVPTDLDPAYLAPEQTGAINRRVDERSDFYSLGVLLYRLLTGRLPFQGDDARSWAHRHVVCPPPPPAELDAEIPRAVSDLVLKLLTKEADDRYQSARGLGADLQTCLAQLEAMGRIIPFALASQDATDRFRLPQRLYGRENELATLTAVFERVAEAGWPELVMVCGSTGVGKTALVHELRQSIVRRHGYFVSGKFDRYQRDVPYAALARAFQSLVQQILAEGEAEIAQRRLRLQAALGTNGQLLVDFVPQLAPILGPQPAVVALPPAEAQSRLHAFMQRFLGALAIPQQPLVLFLDDLQWLDGQSLKLLEYLITHPDTRNLLFVGAYRQEEVSPAHPLMAALARIGKVGVKVLDIALRPLAAEAVERLVADTLHGPAERSAPLARWVFARTQGNPFFSVQLLAALQRQGLLVFDGQQRSWSWKFADIEARGGAESVMEVLTEKLKWLGEVTEEVLRLAGCLGNTFALATLAWLWGRSEEETEQALAAAVQEGLIQSRDGIYKFLHDHVQQAACELIPAEQRAEVHLQIGRRLLATTPPDAAGERLFETVIQLNLGAAGITAAEERTRVAELNLRAARQAKAATAYQAAASYLAAAARLLGCEAWERREPLAFAIFLERAECEMLCGNFARAEHLFPPLLQYAPTRLDKAAVYRIKIDTLTIEGKDEEAIDSALECLRLFDIDLSPHPSAAEVETACEEVWENLGARAIEELLDLPQMADAELRAAMDILARLYAPAYHLDNNLFYLHLCHGVNLSLKHGNSPASTHAYGWFGVVLTCVYQRPEEGRRFARLAFDLMERHNFLAYKARAIFVLRIIAFWSEPLERMLEYSRAAFEAAVETGDVPGACFSRNHTVMGMLLRGDRLPAVQHEADSALAFVRRAGFRDVHDMIVAIERLVQALRGHTRHLATFDDEHFSEETFEAQLTGERMPTLLFYYYVVKLMARFLAGDYQGALAAGEKSRDLLWAGLFSAQGHAFHFYHALTLSAVFDTLAPEERSAARALLADHRESLRQAAQGYPPTFQHSYLLVAAEIARLEGRELEAERLYEEAIGSAQAHGFIQDEAIAHELAGRFHHARGLATIAGSYFRHAHAGYLRWGAQGKVRQLEASHPQLQTEPALPVERQLATLGVVKASQVISSQILLDPLLDTLMQQVMANSCARKGALLLLQPDGLVLAAEAQVDGEHIAVRRYREKRDFAALLPVSVIDQVRRSRESVVLADEAPQPFADDGYFSRQRPRSALCLPIICRAELIGLLYLENERVSHLFTPERLAVLDLLASQAAISLDSALLYRRLRQENARRRRIERALRTSEARFRTGFAHAVIGMALLNAEGRFTQVNRSLCDLLGYTEAELLGRPFTDITHPEDVQSSLDQVQRLLAGEADSFQMTKRYLHKDGAELWAEVGVALIRPDGATASLVVQIQDITERRRAEEALSESQQLLQGIIDNSTAVIYVKDLQGRFLLVNRRCRELFHIVPGVTVYDLFAREQADALHASDQAALAAGTAVQAEEEVPQEDGIHTYISIKAPIRDSSGRVYAVCGISTDITERKKAERHQTAQYAITGVLAGSATLAEAAPELLQILCESLSWELGELWAVDAKAQLLRHLQSWHVPSLKVDEFVDASRDVTCAPGAGLPGRVWQKGEPEWVADVLTDNGFLRSIPAAAAGLHGALAFPIRLGSQSLGVVVFFSRGVRQPDAELMEILATIGSQIGQFMERKRAEEELRFSEERYRALHRDNPTMIFTLDAEGRVLSVNPFAASQLGFTIEELEGQSVLNVFHADDREAVAEQLRNCLRHPNRVYRWHLRKIRKDGALLWVEELAQAVYGPEGVLNVLVVCQDITERKQAEEALRQQEERFRYVAMATRDAIYDWDIVLNLFWYNDAYRDLYSRDEAAGTDIGWWKAHLHPEDRQRIVESLHSAFRQRRSFWADEYRFSRIDGSFTSVVDRGYILYDEQGEPVRMIGAMTDVTERKRALVEAEAARDKIDAILRSVADGLLVTDLADRVTLMNEAAEALLGIGFAGNSGRHIDVLLAEESLRRQIVEVRRGDQEKALSEWERQEFGGSRVRVLQAQTTAVRSAEGRRTGTITILRDITREREIDRMKNEFISTAAHELRTPLTTVMGYVQLLQQEEHFTAEERKEFLQLVYEKSEVLDRIIRDLLDLSRVQAGKLVTVQRARADLAALLRHAVAAYQGIAARHVFRLDLPEEAVELCLDSIKIGQVLDNLFSNAVKFSPDGGTIRVSGRRLDGEFEVTVEDEGIGMGPEQVGRIFDKFYRADASNTAVSGLGLGMSIVRNIVEAHGGRIWVESEPGRGTKVHFTLALDGECPDR